jgi:SAM-dependent methyltransferase
MSGPARIAYESCPLCRSAAYSRLRQASVTQHPSYKAGLPPTITWMRCDSCGHVFTDGYFNDAALELMFSGDVQGQIVGQNFLNARTVSARIVSRVARYAPGGAWLDVGFGNGSLLFTAEEFGYSCVGVDMRSQNVEQLARLGFEAHHADVCDLDAPGRFSVVSMADVLEHMAFPLPAIAAARNCLQPGGVLLASMPNYDCTAWRLMGEGNPYWVELEHYHNFSRLTLIDVMRQNGFSLLEYGVSERYIACMEVLFRRD